MSGKAIDLVTELERFRGKLLDLSLRNPLLNYRKSPKKTLQIVDELPDEVYRILVEQNKVMKLLADLSLDKVISEQDELIKFETSPNSIAPLMSATAPKSKYSEALPIEEIDGKERRFLDDGLQTNICSIRLHALMRTIGRDAKATIEETGINYLHLAIGFLKWKENDSSTAEQRLAPLILIPVEVEVRQTGPFGTEYVLRWNEDDIQSNTSLRKKLQSDFGIELPDLEEDERPDAFFKRIEKKIAYKKDWSIERQMLLGFFSFHKLSMYVDIDPQNWAETGALSQNSLASRLVIGGASSGNSGIYASDYDIDEHPIARSIELPLDADSSQQSAIADIAEGKNLVIEGPPGTGKSQTITNAIANALRENKTVLFVAEKHAALDVVHRRLVKTGLGDFCLELHGHAVAPKKVLESIAKRISRTKIPSRGSSEGRQKIEIYKSKIKDYVRDTSKAAGPFQEPLYELFWRIVRLRQQGAIANRTIECDTSVDLVTFEQAISALDSFQSTLKDYEAPKESVWWGFFPSDLSPGEASRILAFLPRLKPAAERFRTHALNISTLLGGRIDASYEFVSNGDLDAVRRLASIPIPTLSIPLETISQPDVREAGLQLQEANSEIKITDLELRNLTRGSLLDAKAAFDAFPIGSDSILSKLPAQSSIEQLKEFRVWSETTHELVSRITDRIPEFSRFGFLNVETIDDFERTIRQIHLLQHSVVANEKKLSPDLFLESARNQLANGKSRHEAIAKRLEQVNSLFHLESVPERAKLIEILKTYRANSESYLRLFKKPYRKAASTLKEFSRFPKRFKIKQIIAAIEMLESFHRDKSEFEGDEKLRSLLGGCFQGLRSDWSKIKTLLDWVNTAKKMGFDASRVNALLERKEQLIKAFPIRVMANEVQNLKTQFSPTHAAILGVAANEIGNQSPNRIRDQAATILATMNHLEKVASHLASGSNTTISVVLRIASLFAEKTKNLINRETLFARVSPEILELLQKVEVEACDFVGLVHWADKVGQLKLNSEVRSSFSNRHPNEICSELVTEGEALLAAIDEWTTVRTSMIGTAEVYHSWLQPIEDGKVRLDIGESVKRLELESNRLAAWIAVCRSYSRCKRTGVAAFALAAVNNQLAGNSWSTSYQLTLLERIAELELQQSTLGFDFTTSEIEDVRRSFQEVDRANMKAVPPDIARTAELRIAPEGNGRGRVGEFTELALVLHEISKKTRHCRIRDLMNRAGAAVQALKPCFLMSPLSLARYIPSDKVKFDLVIMDEASQIKPEDAIGAILRAKQLVVVGDPKQLPPTSFFDRSDDELEDDEATQFDNAESVLEVAMKSFQPYRRLKWHYRSQHENLISFSNHRFYDSDLIVFPSPKGLAHGLGLTHHFVDEATCLKGANVREAEEVVAKIVEHAKKYPTQSLGVAAFNQRQAELIQDLLDQACDRDRFAADAIGNLRSLDDELFVKNLESIQGDERDVMFISYTYGPDPTTRKVFQRFGPINSDMGWRRLNVMITRARKRMEVFSSMRPSEIHSGPDKSRGVNAYREFLAFAESGKMIESGSESGREPGSPFEEAVAELISRFGLEPVFQVGVAGYFIDIGVRRLGEARDFILGIECDGATYHSSRSARDRDRLREEIIRERGWRLHRIWSTEWFLNQQQEELRLQRVLEECWKDSP